MREVDMHAKKKSAHLNASETSAETELIELPSFDGQDDEQLADLLEARLRQTRIDTRDPLPSGIEKLDEDQRAVIAHESPVLRVLAPAGAGKTLTQVYRACRLIRDGALPQRILILTFDRAAASAVTTKFRDVAEGSTRKTPGVLTLNAFGMRTLREYFPEETRPLIDLRKAGAILRNLRATLKGVHPQADALLPFRVKTRFYLEMFSLLKNQVLDPRTSPQSEVARVVATSRVLPVFLANCRNVQDQKLVVKALAWLYVSQEKMYQAARLMDFDDQKLRTLAKLREAPDVLGAILGSYDEIIVDEFQDINLLDFELIKTISTRARLIVTGDDDQAIYGFRGCSPEYIIALADHLDRPVETVELRRNYRCPRNIVEHASRLIRHNKDRLPKNPIAVRETDASIKVVSAITTAVECRLAVTFLERTKRSTANAEYRDFAILYRTNAQSLPIQIQLILREIPFYVRKEDNILESAVLDRLLSVLRVRQAYQDGLEPEVEDALQTFRAYFPWSEEAVVDRFRHFLLQGASLRSRLRGDEPYAVGQMEPFFAAIRGLTRKLNLVDVLVELGKQFQGLHGMVGSLEDVANDDVPLGEIIELAASYRSKPRDFIKKIETTLQKAREIGAGTDQEHGVSLATYFRSKGLQWHTVLLLGCNQGLIPMNKAPLHEERRLFYVALTRASSNLYLSYVKKSCGHMVEPSQFLVESGLIPAMPSEQRSASPGT